MFPENADIWNVVATAVQFREGKEASIIFYEEALRLEPDNYKVLNNLSTVIADQDVANQYVVRALEIVPENPEVHLSQANYMLRKGQLEEGWRHYEYRMNPRRVQAQNMTYTHKLPPWDGKAALEGKTVFATCEQGIGDEIMFAVALRELEKKCAKLFIGVDHRLVSIFKRAFPDATVDRYRDGMLQGYRYRTFIETEKKLESGELAIDHAIPFATVAQHFWKRTEDVKFPEEGYLCADPKLSASFRDRIEALGPGLKVGITWQSGTLSAARQFGYLKLADIEPLLRTSGVQFINLQYSDVSKQVAEFQEETGLKLHRFEDVDLKANIEANLAIMENLDLIIGPVISTQIFAASINKPVWWFTQYKPWWTYGAEEGVPWAPSGRYFPRFPDTDWKRTVQIVTNELAAFVSKAKQE